MVLLACSLSFCYTKSDTNTMINIDRKIRKDFAMWIADQWKDYEIIDTSKGEKLERWGDYLLVRPDPVSYTHLSIFKKSTVFFF